MDSLDSNINTIENPFSLQNRFYPLSSLNSEMERLFGTHVYHEKKPERGKEDTVLYDLYAIAFLYFINDVLILNSCV